MVISTARADDLILPYACALVGGTPQLIAGEMNTFHIFGRREDQKFPPCSQSMTAACETMMIHKFTIECGGQRVPWSRVAASARAIGVELPQNLPPGYAPIGRLGGRFVLPELVRSTPAITQVSMQDLSPDSVIVQAHPRPRNEVAQWVTVVDSAAMTSTSGEAFKVAGVITTLMASLMAASLIVARRRNLLTFDFAALPSLARAFAGRALGIASSAMSFLANSAHAAFRHSYESWQAASDGDGGDAHLSSTLAFVRARLAETDFLVATLPADLLLRDVLEQELDGLRDRAADISRRAHRLGGGKASAYLRGILRDLDRITRIVHGAGQSQDEAPTQPDTPIPSSVFEAYRVLGLNPQAPHAAVKKVVDALRMSWHPDHASDEADRLYRESRIKQINAAWDLLKGAEVVAA